MSAKFDHIVIGASSLEQGVEWAKNTLGIEVPRGGRHEKMATHNCVMSFGDDSYLEIVAVNPNVPPVSRPRWFGLDNPTVQKALKREPQLLTWAINVDDIKSAFSNLSNSGFSVPICIEAMTRDALRWQVGFAENGELIDVGLFPLVIEWDVPQHPSRAMVDLNCKLLRLDIISTQIEITRSNLSTIGALAAINTLSEGDRDEVIVTLQTPVGERQLCSYISSD